MISVVIPMYNSQNTIRRCLNSVSKQTFRDIEIIVVDDGSTDDGPDIVKEMAANDNRIIYLPQKNEGASSARNRGIETGRGEYLCFIDSDDSVDEKYIEKLYDKLKETNSDVSICGFNYIKDDVYNHIVLNDEEYGKLQGYISTDYYRLRAYMDSPCMKIYRTGIIKKGMLRFRNDMFTAEDQYFNLSYYSLCETVSFVNEPLYNYFIGNTGLTSKTGKRYFENDLENLLYKKRILEGMKAVNSDLVLAQNICNIARRYTAFSDEKDSMSAYCRRISSINILERPIKLSNRRDNLFYQLIRRKLYFIIYLYSKINRVYAHKNT